MSEDLEDPIHEDLEHEEVDDQEEGEDDAEGDRERPSRDAPDEEDEGREGEENDGVPKRVSRGSARIQKLNDDAKKAREEAETARREVQEIKAQQQEATRRREEEESLRRREEEESLRRREFMTPDEIRADDLTIRLNKVEAEAGYQRFANWDHADRQNFHKEAERSPVAARFAAKVEAEYERLAVQNGRATSRIEIYWSLRGKESAQRETEVVKKAKKTGEANIRKQTTRPGNSKSNVSAASNVDERQARIARLTGRPIWS